MPALITHHIFAEDAVLRLPEGMVSGQEELLAFLLGNQGPDPLFSRFLGRPLSLMACHELGIRMHHELVRESFVAMRDAVARLWPEDMPVGRAFALGFLGHYALDSNSHPFVYAEQKALVEANPELVGSEMKVHNVIEADIDSWLLWQKRHATVEDRHPAEELTRTDRVDRVASALIAQVALQVFGIQLGARDYALSVRDYQFLYRQIEPLGSKAPLVTVASRVERMAMATEHSKLVALQHPITMRDECAAANLDRAPWKDPSTGAVSYASFADLFHDTLDLWPSYAEAFSRGDWDRFSTLCHGVNYDGELV